MLLHDDECELFALPELDDNPQRQKFKTSASLEKKSENDCSIASFIGDPIPNDEALKLGGWRYEVKVVELVIFPTQILFFSWCQVIILLWNPIW